MDIIPHKLCSRCQQTKPSSDFSKGPRYRDGLQSYCRACMAEYRTEKRRDPAYVETLRQKGRDYFRNNEEARNHNRERGRVRDHFMWHNAPEHRARKNAQKKVSNQKPERREKRRTWSRAITQRRRVRATAAGPMFTRAEWAALCERYDHRCLACGQAVPLVSDHIRPLVLGGSNSIDNIQPLCALCNAYKGIKIIDYRT